MAQLTPRQQDIMKLLAEGYSQKETAKALGMAYGTVRKHTLAARNARAVAARRRSWSRRCRRSRRHRTLVHLYAGELGATLGVASFHSEAGGWQRSI